MSEYMEDDDIECFGDGGIIHEDEEGNKYYTSFRTQGLIVRIGDCVRVQLEDEAYGYCQVLSIFEDQTEAVYMEVRWFKMKHELQMKSKKAIEFIQEEELIETDMIDDIYAGSACEIFTIQGSTPLSNTDQVAPSQANHLELICRYLECNDVSGLQKVHPFSLLRRGMSYSHHEAIYSDYCQSLYAQTSNASTSSSSALNHTMQKVYNDYTTAMQRLQISVIPDELPCRDAEKRQIESYLRDAIVQGEGSAPYYICGMPGTGKTATVVACINSLRKQVETNSIPNFRYTMINCLQLKSPNEVYTQLWRGVSGYTNSSKSAMTSLYRYFEDKQTVATYTVPSAMTDGDDMNEDDGDIIEGTKKAKKKRLLSVTGKEVIVCVLDELEYLFTRDSRIIFNIFDFTLRRHSAHPLVLIAIGNTMDLVEKISARITSRSNFIVNRLAFPPYLHPQVQEILTQRLSSLSLPAFNTKVIEYIARKAVTTVCDLRAALQICQASIQMYRDTLMTTQLKTQLPTETNSGGTAGNGISSDVLMIFEYVKQAANKYRLHPLIAKVSLADELSKAIIITFVKYRRLVCGEDYSAAADMDCETAWLRFQDLMDKVEMNRFYYTNVQKAAVTSSGSASSASAVSTVQGEFVPQEEAVESTQQQQITLQRPPYHIFCQSVQRLQSEYGFLECHFSSRYHVMMYRVTNNLQYTDLIAALSQDPWKQFVIV